MNLEQFNLTGADLGGANLANSLSWLATSSIQDANLAFAYVYGGEMIAPTNLRSTRNWMFAAELPRALFDALIPADWRAYWYRKRRQSRKADSLLQHPDCGENDPCCGGKNQTPVPNSHSADCSINCLAMCRMKINAGLRLRRALCGQRCVLTLQFPREIAVGPLA